MNTASYDEEQHRYSFDRFVPAIACGPSSSDDEVCSVTPEPSLILTNSSISFNSASTSSFHRDRDCGRTTYDQSSSSLPMRLPLVSTHSSLLDIERDDSLTSPEDEGNDDVSLGNDVQYHSVVTSAHQPLESGTTSFMEQTENNLVNISETLTGSFCNQGEISNPCHISDCCLSKDEINESNKSLSYSDQIVQNRLMDDFNYLLGNEATPCCEERDVFCNFFFRPSQDVGFEAEFSGNGDSKIRNRAGESWRARAYRIKRLRESRNAYDSPNAWNNDQHQGVRQSYSMDGHRHQMKTKQSAERHSSQRRRTRQSKPKHEINSDPLGCIIGDCIEPILNIEGEENELEVVLRQQDQHDFLFGEDLCYDSDPGESSCRTFETINSESAEHNANRNHTRSKSDQVQHVDTTWKKAPPAIPLKRRRRMHFDSILESNSDDDTFQDDCNENSVAKHETRMSLTDYHDNSSATHYGDCHSHEIEESSNENGNSQCLNADEDMFWNGGYTKNSNSSGRELDMIRTIQNALNRTWTLTWHPTSADFPNESIKSNSPSFRSPLRSIQTNKKKDSNVSAMPPRCIQLWFERGNRIRRNDIVEPKLMWREAYHPDLASHRKLNASSTQRPHQVCLLGICRILEATSTLDRKKYPFAKKSCSFIIRTCDDNEYVFEARSEESREQILDQWKMVVARLASQAVVGDGEGMVGEFFVPTSFAVP